METQATVKNPKHSSKSVEWYTPEKYIEAARDVLGSIDLDPASSAKANERVRAKRYYDEAHNGLDLSWGLPNGSLNLFMNPPGGKVANKSLAKLFWQKLLLEADLGYINHAIVLFYSMEALQTTQIGCARSAAHYPMCIPDRRISFIDQDGKKVTGNTHASVIIYVPGETDRTETFLDVFSTFGVTR